MNTPPPRPHLDADKLETYISYCEERLSAYRQSREKIVLLAASLFTLLLSATGLLGASDTKQIGFGIWHLLFLDATLVGFWLLYLNRRLRGKLYSANLAHARRLLAATHDSDSSNSTYSAIWNTLQGKERVASTRWFVRWGVIVIFTMYCLATTALLTTTLNVQLDASLALVATLKAVVLLPTLYLHARYRSTTRLLKERINSEWESIAQLSPR